MELKEVRIGEAVMLKGQVHCGDSSVCQAIWLRKFPFKTEASWSNTDFM